MLHNFIVLFFAIATGFAASGIVASLYRLLVPKAESGFARTAEIGVLVVAGPTMLMGRFITALREKSCSRGLFWLVTAVAAYWSLAIGLLVLSVALHI
jgi:hypothetical protein